MPAIYKLFAMGIFIAIADTILTKADRKDIAYILTLVGMIIGFAILIPQIYNLLRMVEFYFPPR